MTDNAVTKLEAQRSLTVEVLRELLRYEPETGKLFWRKRPLKYFADTPARPRSLAAKIWNARDAGTEAITATGSGGSKIGAVLGHRVSAHRVGFAIFHGHLPDLIDHINGDSSDNRICNLRPASRAQNGQNAASRGGLSRYCGVSYDPRYKKWIVQCAGTPGQGRYIGSFKTEIEAARAYDAAAIARHGEYAKTNFGGQSNG